MLLYDNYYRYTSAIQSQPNKEMKSILFRRELVGENGFDEYIMIIKMEAQNGFKALS